MNIGVDIIDFGDYDNTIMACCVNSFSPAGGFEGKYHCETKNKSQTNGLSKIKQIVPDVLVQSHFSGFINTVQQPSHC